MNINSSIVKINHSDVGANRVGDLIGQKAVYRPLNGSEPLVGVLERDTLTNGVPTSRMRIRFASGQWVFATFASVELVNE